MAGTNRFMNWTGGVFTPSGGSAIYLTGVTKCDVAPDVSFVKFKGDLAQYDQAVATPSKSRVITVDLADAHTVLAMIQGNVGVFSITLLDAANGATPGGGGFTVTLNPCVVGKKAASDSHAQFATSSIVFEGYAADGPGIVDPLTITPL
jgi:hypothetical protein